jgi:segregation and condensation protein B
VQEKMQINEKISILEAILFACGEPVEAEKLSLSSGIENELIPKLISLLNDRYSETKSALRVLKLSGSYQLSTRAELSGYIKTALENKRTATLSPAAMEVLTIVAYNPPVT